MWQESGLTQQQFCDREKLSVKTFGNWLKKYREKGSGKEPGTESSNAFIPVELPGTVELPPAGANQIEITYPGGTRVTCPANIGIQQLKTLIHL
jgi:hypothetical protein